MLKRSWLEFVTSFDRLTIQKDQNGETELELKIKIKSLNNWTLLDSREAATPDGFDQTHCPDDTTVINPSKT